MNNLFIILWALCLLQTLQKSPLETLEFSQYENPTQDQIKTRFRQLSKKYHPDRNPSPQARSKYEEIINAYEILTKQNPENWHFEKNNGGSYYYRSSGQFNTEDFMKMEQEMFKQFQTAFGEQFFEKEESSFTINFSDLIFSQLGYELFMFFLQIGVHLLLVCCCCCLACKELKSCCGHLFD